MPVNRRSVEIAAPLLHHITALYQEDELGRGMSGW